MVAYFLDSSAVVKRYIREAGTAWIVGISHPTAGNELFVASVTGIEVVSAISRRRIGGTVAPAIAVAALSQFRQDFVHQYQIVGVSETIVDRAMLLAENHGLRAYDALQLASILEASDVRAALSLPALTLVSADRDLNTVAQAEGVAVIDPNSQP